MPDLAHNPLLEFVETPARREFAVRGGERAIERGEHVGIFGTGHGKRRVQDAALDVTFEQAAGGCSVECAQIETDFGESKVSGSVWSLSLRVF